MELNGASRPLSPGGSMAEFRKAQEALAAALEPRAGEKVTIAYPHLDTFGANFVESVLRMAAYDKAHGNHLLHNSGLMHSGALASVWGRSTELSHARNTGAAAFLSSDSDWLLWWDTDIGCEPDALEKLLSVADPVTRPIVGGLCFIEGEFTHDGRGGLRGSLAPTLYDWSWVEPKSGMPGSYKLVNRQDWATDDVTRVAATGCGFILVHRTAFEKIASWSVEGEAPPHIWYERIPGPDGEKCGEDISFCLRAHQVGLPVYVHTGVTTTHQKTIWYGVPEYRMKPFTPPPMTALPLPPEQWPLLQINPDAVKHAQQNSPIRNKQVPESLAEVAIIVPVAKRNNAKTFMASLTDSLTSAQWEKVSVYVMADEDDVETRHAWCGAISELGPRLMINGHHYLREMGSFAEKVNRGFELTTESWVFLVGDDVRFHPGWLDQAMDTARATNARVVGTNDLGSHAVLSGEHATHFFVRRDYVETLGASWDGPGILCHEGYRHWYVDNEVILAAKMRGEWAPCLASHVEHLHPYYGKAAVDEVYEIGEAASTGDRALWERRANKYYMQQEESA